MSEADKGWGGHLPHMSVAEEAGLRGEKNGGKSLGRDRGTEVRRETKQGTEMGAGDQVRGLEMGGR